MPRKNESYMIVEDHYYTSGIFRANSDIVFMKLKSLAKKGYCYASDQWLSLKLNIPIRTVQRYLQNLEKRGLIKRASKHKKLDAKERKIYITETIFDTPNLTQPYANFCQSNRQILSNDTSKVAVIQYKDSIKTVKQTVTRAKTSQEIDGFNPRENELAEKLCFENIGFTRKQAYSAITCYGFEKTNAIYEDVINQSNIANKGGAIQYRLKNGIFDQKAEEITKEREISDSNWEMLDKQTREPLKTLKYNPCDPKALQDLETILDKYPTKATNRPLYENLPNGKTATVCTVYNYVEREKQTLKCL